MVKSIQQLPSYKVGDILETDNGSLWCVTSIIEIEDDSNSFTDSPMITFKIVCNELVDGTAN